MRFYNILILLPALAYCAINFDIQVNPTEIDLLITGEDRSIISDNDVSIFGILNDTLKNCSIQYLGGYPTDIFIKSPTPWNLYEKYGWLQTRRVLTPISSTLTTFKTVEVLLKSNFIFNNELEPISFKANVTYEVKNLKTFWRDNVTLTDYKMTVSIVNGTELKKYTAKNYVLKSEIDVIVNPGQELAIEIYAIDTKICALVDFELSLTGNMIMNYEKLFRGHHFYAPNIEEVMSDCGLSNKLQISADIELNFYEKPRLVIRDKDNNIVILNKVLTD